jgi:hypothetical protein
VDGLDRRVGSSSSSFRTIAVLAIALVLVLLHGLRSSSSKLTVSGLVVLNVLR